MEFSTVSSVRGRYAGAPVGRREELAFFRRHPMGGIVRGLLFSSVLWVLIAIGVYAVYSMVLGS